MLFLFEFLGFTVGPPEIFGFRNVMRKILHLLSSLTVQTIREHGLGSHNKHTRPQTWFVHQETEALGQELSAGANFRPDANSANHLAGAK